MIRPFQRFFPFTLFMVGATLALAACETPVTYSYFDVAVSVDRTTVDEDTLAVISSCAVEVTVNGEHADSADLPCVRGTVRYDLGHFDYSTSAKKGSLVFVVTAKHNQTEVARGTSKTLGIVPNVTVPTSIVVKGLGLPGTGPAGADAAVP